MTGQTAQLPLQVRIALEEVARHCRRRLVIRGGLHFAVATVLLLTVGTAVLALAPPAQEPNAAALLIAALGLLELMALWRWLLRPRLVPIPVEQVALYIDENQPELQNRMISAIEFSRPAGSGVPPSSRWMVEQLLAETDTAARTLSLNALTPRRWLVLGRLATLGLLAAAGALIVQYGGYWVPALPAFHTDAPRPMGEMPFTVSPGDTEVRVGSHVVVMVETQEAGEPVAIAWRAPGGVWETASMAASAGPQTHHHEFRNIQSDREYQVQSGRHQSPVFRIHTWEPPRVDAIHLSYHYPEYLNRPPDEAPNSGPISAVEGTRVGLDVVVNKPIESAAMVRDSGGRIPLTAASPTQWAGEFTVDQNDAYVIEVIDADGRTSEYQPRYDIAALRDKTPDVRIQFPRGDDEVTSIEEIPFTVDVTDDFGLAALGIQFEVTGREPVRVALAEWPEPTGEPVLTAQGEHLLMLEDLGLEPGDLVTWTVWTADRKPDRDAYETLGDPYFLEVRPFARTFEEAISNAGAGGGQQGQGEDSGPAAEQRDVLIATWNLRRRAAQMSDGDYDEARQKIIAAQLALLEQTRQQTGPMLPGLPQSGDAAGPVPAHGEGVLLEQLAQAQQQAVEALERAEALAPEEPLTEAMGHEQEAYSLIKKLEPERRSVQQAQGGQGGGGGRSANQDELDRLEMARNRNFYEEEQLTQAPADNAAEAARQALDDLLQRQQIANDELARLISEMQQAETEEEREELARRLERLQEEMAQNLERLDQLASEMNEGGLDPAQTRQAQQGLQEARREMNRSLENLRGEQLQQARAAGSRAADAIDDTRRDLAGLSTEAAAEGMRDVRERMAELEARQESVMDRLEALRDRAATRALDDLTEQKAEQQDLIEEKRALAEDVQEAMEDAARLAEGTQQSQPLLSRKLNDWLRETSGTGLLDRMRETEPLVDYGIWDPAIEQESLVREELAEAARGLGAVENYLVEDEADALRLALRQIRGALDAPQGAPGQPGEEPAGSAQDGTATEDAEQPDGAPASGASSGQEGGAPSEPATGSGEPTESESPTPGGQPGEQADGQQRGQAGAQDSPGGGQSAQGQSGQRSGGWSGGFGPEDLGGIFENGYGRWNEALRDAESLLPADPADAGRGDAVTPRQRLGRARDALGEMNRDYRGGGVAPRFEAFLERVVLPMEEAAAEIERQLEVILQAQEFHLDPRVAVPPQYQDRVAHYFRVLSEAEARTAE